MLDHWRGPISVVVAGVVLIGIHFAIFDDFFPNAAGRLGSDYGYFLPRMLDGYFWRTSNDFFAVPWVTPSFCGGLPYLPSPQALYYSLPQLLLSTVPPLTSLKLTLLAFSTLGFAGLYLLARRVFLLGSFASLLGATLFLFNGLFTARLIIGHLTFHSFMLAPLIFFFLQRPPKPRSVGSLWRYALDVTCAGTMIAYVASTSLAHTLFPMLLAAVIVALLQMIVRPTTFAPTRYAIRLALAGLLAISICAAKLASIHAYVSLFPRDLYGLPGIPSLWTLLEVVVRALFSSPPSELAHRVMIDSRWPLERHEFEFGVTPVPLLIILAAAGIALVRGDWLDTIRRFELSRWLAIASMLALLALPIALNLYSPEWNALLKRVPVIGVSVTLFRWLSVYIPVAILIAIITLDRASILRDSSRQIALVGVGATLLLSGFTDRTDYQRQPYDPTPILDAYALRAAGSLTPEVTHIRALLDWRGREILNRDVDGALVGGGSSLPCYETLFGYRLEHFPRGSLKAGPIRDAQTGAYNLKNPSCYVFPEENECSPGDHFGPQDSTRADSFVHYRGMSFEMPLRQRLANRVSLAAITGVAVFWMASALGWLRSRWRVVAAAVSGRASRAPAQE